MNAKRIQDAEKLVKKGDEHLKTTMFKWQPDVDSAIECFDKGFFSDQIILNSSLFFLNISRTRQVLINNCIVIHDSLKHSY